MFLINPKEAWKLYMSKYYMALTQIYLDKAHNAHMKAFKYLVSEPMPKFPIGTIELPKYMRIDNNADKGEIVDQQMTDDNTWIIVLTSLDGNSVEEVRMFGRVCDREAILEMIKTIDPNKYGYLIQTVTEFKKATLDGLTNNNHVAFGAPPADENLDWRDKKLWI